eukprot:822961-Rhodomonas_salina.7
MSASRSSPDPLFPEKTRCCCWKRDTPGRERAGRGGRLKEGRISVVGGCCAGGRRGGRRGKRGTEGGGVPPLQSVCGQPRA